MIAEDVRTVHFMSEQNAEDLYRCNENGRVYVRQRCDDDCVRWLTSVKWREGYEASAPMREGMILRIVDPRGKVLYEETLVHENGYCDTVAKKKAPFSDEAIKQQAKAVAEQANLRSYVEWKTWMMRYAREHKYTGYSENWCFAEVEYSKPRTLFNFEYLGVPAYCIAEDAVHKISGQKWTCIEIRDKSKQTVLEICGYQFEEEKK